MATGVYVPLNPVSLLWIVPLSGAANGGLHLGRICLSFAEANINFDHVFRRD